MELIDLRTRVLESDADLDGPLTESDDIAVGQGALAVRYAHMLPDPAGPGRDIDRSALGELPDGHDHLFVVLSGRGRVSGGGIIRTPIKAGQAAYFPKEEGYLIFADKPLTGILLKGSDLALSLRALQAAA